jgi:hypothetical protein
MNDANDRLRIAFYFAFSILGLKGSAIRGDFLLYIMSESSCSSRTPRRWACSVPRPASAMMKHAPMNTIVSITSAIAALYTRVAGAAQ